MSHRRNILASCFAASAALIPAIVLADGGSHSDEAAVAATSMTSPMIGGISLVLALVVTTFVSMRSAPRMSMRQSLILGLGIVTAAAHIILGLSGDFLLLLNGLGYAALLIILFVPLPRFEPRRFQIQLALLAYTTVTFVGYFLLHVPEHYDSLALFTKAVELLLIVLLGAEVARARNSGRLTVGES